MVVVLTETGAVEGRGGLCRRTAHQQGEKRARVAAEKCRSGAQERRFGKRAVILKRSGKHCGQWVSAVSVCKRGAVQDAGGSLLSKTDVDLVLMELLS